MDIDTFERINTSHTKVAVKDAEVIDDFTDGEELLAVQDLLEALDLLNRVKTVIDYVSDAKLVTTVTKRERDVMQKLSTQIYDFLDETQDKYED